MSYWYVTFASCAFGVATPTIWNSLSVSFRKCSNLLKANSKWSESPLSALLLLVGWQEGHLAYKKFCLNNLEKFTFGDRLNLE